MHDPSRRRLLQALGLAGGAMVLPSSARALARPPPRRILFFVTSHGTVHQSWNIRGGKPDNVDYDNELVTLPPEEMSEILQPLWSHRSRITVIDGVGNGCAPTAGFLAHPAGNASCQTGAVPIEVMGSYARTAGPSIDQVIAATKSTPFPSLEWGVGGAPVSYSELGQPLPVEYDPVAAWERLFPTASTPDRPLESSEIRSRQGSVLDLALGRYESVIGRLPAEEQVRLSLHRDLVRDLETRIAALDALQCPPPIPRPDAAGLPIPEAPEYPTVYMNLFFDLAVTAMACGMTDVVTLRVDTIPTATVGAPPGDLHNDIAHSVSSDDESRLWMTRHHAYLATQFALLLDRLATMPDPVGGRMLDSTLVVWHNEMSTGDHLFHTVPVVLAGGGGAVRSGRYFRYAPFQTVKGHSYVEPIAHPHNKLLTTLGVAMGLDIDHFGVTELEQEDGSPLDCTGTLPGVLL